MRDWVVKYYVNKETDVHYEHIVVEPSTVDDCYFAIQFTQSEKKVEADKYGYAFLAPIMDGDYNGKVVKILLYNQLETQMGIIELSVYGVLNMMN
ncbi:MAG: hypothetical protein ACLUOK_09645 [Parabacteroides distasonis]